MRHQNCNRIIYSKKIEESYFKIQAEEDGRQNGLVQTSRHNSELAKEARAVVEEEASRLHTAPEEPILEKIYQ